MRRFPVAVLVISAMAVVTLVGCGGGGGGGTTTTTPPPVIPVTTDRIITATVVSSKDTTKGVAGVNITLGTLGSATTDANGKFSMDLGSSSVELPYYFQVDTSGAGTSFPRSANEVVGFNGQTYRREEVDIPVAMLNGLTNNLGTIVVTEVTGDVPPPIPYPSNDTIITGRIVSAASAAGIANVSISFGDTKIVTTTTGAKGYFGLNLGRDEGVLAYYPSASGVFSINTSTAGDAYPVTLQVSFNDQTTPQSSVIVPIVQLVNGSRSLGTIKVLDDGSGGDIPPPPPF